MNMKTWNFSTWSAGSSFLFIFYLFKLNKNNDHKTKELSLGKMQYP